MATANETSETFEVDGVEYTADPDLETFIKEAGFKTPAQQTRIRRALEKVNITEVTPIFGRTRKDLSEIDGISAGSAQKIYIHAQRVMRQGNIVMDYDDLRKRELNFRYLPTGSSLMDEMLTYSNGQVGWRSKTMIELYGQPSSGKTQICLTASAMVMRSPEEGGWGQGVVFIDSEGSFEGLRYEALTRYWGVDSAFLSNNLYYSRVHSFDDVEAALESIGTMAKEKNIGLIVLDSIMDPLKSQYPVGGSELSNLQPRQKHLKRVLDKLKSLADIHNLVTIYTNHIRSEIGNTGGPDYGAQGGAVLGHASDIRILLDRPNKKQRESIAWDNDYQEIGLKTGRAKIVDCGFLADTTGFFVFGPMGIGDPVEMTRIVGHAKQIHKDGYISINAKGDPVAPLHDDAKDKETNIELFRKQLYGE